MIRVPYSRYQEPGESIRTFRHETEMVYGVNEETCHRVVLGLGAEMLHPD